VRVVDADGIWDLVQMDRARGNKGNICHDAIYVKRIGGYADGPKRGGS
jgi:hypothetical protein